MKLIISAVLMFLATLSTFANGVMSHITNRKASANAVVVDKVEPPYWWTGMHQDTLQIMLYGPEIATCQASLSYPGVHMIEEVRLENSDYLLLYLKISPDAKPGTMNIVLTKDKKRTIIPYQLKARDADAKNHGGFDASDVLYLVMPDRFARGKNSPSDAERNKGLQYPSPVDRDNPNGRHGGDLQGLSEHLDYIESLGVTAIWVNPVLTNDMPGGSYHGYATTDYYSIDPRLGTNEEWSGLVADAHSRGLKVVMDMIFNHTGSNHPWFVNRPSSDWYNFPDKFEQTNFRLTTIFDPYASEYDHRRTVDGWFVESMPDLNQRNPHLMKYLVQNSIWWIESSKIDGIRMDTYPYADKDAMAAWIDAVEAEYPNFNIVGECWYANEGAEAYWQRGSKANPHFDPRLPTVMDFVLSIKARDAFQQETTPWTGLNDIYDHLALDYLFPEPQKILTFLDNHDTDRFLLEEPDDLGWWKQAMAFLLTTRGIPQIYYGTEMLMHGSKEGSDGFVRKDMPGGFDGDEIDVFTMAGRNAKQREAYDFLSRVLNFRKGNDIIAKGTLKHFMPTNSLYVYERAIADRQVIVIMNGTDEFQTVDMGRYAEIMPVGTMYYDILRDEPVTITEEMTFAPRALLILCTVRNTL